MGANALSGLDGDVLVGTAIVAEIKSWALDEAADVLDTHTFDDGRDKTILPSGIARTGSFVGNWYYGDTTGQKALHDAFKGGTSVTLKLQTDTGNNVNGTAYIVGVNKSAPVSGLIEATFNFQFTGSVTESYG